MLSFCRIEKLTEVNPAARKTARKRIASAATNLPVERQAVAVDVADVRQTITARVGERVVRVAHQHRVGVAGQQRTGADAVQLDVACGPLLLPPPLVLDVGARRHDDGRLAASASGFATTKTSLLPSTHHCKYTTKCSGGGGE